MPFGRWDYIGPGLASLEKQNAPPLATPNTPGPAPPPDAHFIRQKVLTEDKPTTGNPHGKSPRVEAFHVCLYGLGVFESPFAHVPCTLIHAANTNVLRFRVNPGDMGLALGLGLW